VRKNTEALKPMASLEYIKYTPMVASIVDAKVVILPLKGAKTVDGLPQLFWADRSPWIEPNLWAHARATSGGIDLRTVRSYLQGLRSYAAWLEETRTDWRHFPLRQAERCLVRYRGELINQRNTGRIAPSTAAGRMAAIVQFYRWALAEGLLAPSRPIWTDRHYDISISDPTGAARSLRVRSTDLSIPNRRAPGIQLEGGVQPVSAERRDAILTFARDHASPELYLMLLTGFSTGMRIGTIADLKLATLENATTDEATPTLYWIAVGPRAHPKVKTKGSVTGQIPVPRDMLAQLVTYGQSLRRTKRQAFAAPSNRDLLFLTSRGNPYVRAGSDQSSAINTAIHALRKGAAFAGLDILRGFHFHRTRATFATEYARLALEVTKDAYSAIALVQTALMHKREATSLAYIRFIQREATKAMIADEFMAAFSGALSQTKLVGQ
jgi:integrase